MHRKTLLIGDIHGCFREMQALLDKAGLGDGDTIIALGDIVDRGPASPEVLAFFQTTANAHSLMGNHERKHMRAMRGELKLALSQKITRQQFLELGLDYETAVSFMSRFPLYLEWEDVLLVHGYLEPGVPLDQQRPTVLCGTMGGEKYLASQYGRPWYELYDGDKVVIVGHKNYTGSERPFVYRDRVFGLDTDCYKGKALTGLLLPDFRFLSVTADRHHWVEVRRAYKHALALKFNPEIANWEQQRRWLVQAEKWPEPTPEQQAQIARVKAQREEAMALLPGIYAFLQAEHRRILAGVRAAHPDYDALTPRAQGLWYNQALGEMPDINRKLLHRLRQGRLTLETLPDMLNSPAKTLAFAATNVKRDV